MLITILAGIAAVLLLIGAFAICDVIVNDEVEKNLNQLILGAILVIIGIGIIDYLAS